MQSQEFPHPTPRAVFLDRDDTLIANREVTASTAHPGDPAIRALVRLLPGFGRPAPWPCGYALVVVSNQGAARVCTLGQVHGLQRAPRALLRARQGRSARVELDAVYVCRTTRRGACRASASSIHGAKPPGCCCRPPKDLDLDLHRSWMIGTRRDRDAAINAGIPGEH